MYVVTSDPSADTPDALRAASREGNVFRTNSYSDVEDAHPKIGQAVTKGGFDPYAARCRCISGNFALG